MGWPRGCIRLTASKENGYTQMEIRENEKKGKWMGPWVGF